MRKADQSKTLGMECYSNSKIFYTSSRYGARIHSFSINCFFHLAYFMICPKLKTTIKYKI